MATVFLAGATGAVGRPLLRLLAAAGHRVFATTRDPAKRAALRDAGAEPLIVDVFDAEALAAAMREASPEIVIHQLTDLPPALDPARMPEALLRNARLRIDGTRNLVAAAQACGARRVIAQSIAWIYAPGPEPHAEDDPLMPGDEHDPKTITVAGVRVLERTVLQAHGLDGIVLRYGRFYGPGTGFDAAGTPPVVHVDDAAQAAAHACDRGAPGVYNVAEACAQLSTARAQRELGWSPRSVRRE